MKKILIVIITSILFLTGCSRHGDKNTSDVNDYEMHIGYISLDSELVRLDEFEFIRQEDKKRIEELNLSQEDMPNGYYINNESEDINVFEVDNDAEFIFYDTGNIFVEENEDKKYLTKDIEEFKLFLYSNTNTPRRTPFWVGINKEGYVVIIEEEFVN